MTADDPTRCGFSGFRRPSGLFGMLDIVTGHFAFGVATVVTTAVQVPDFEPYSAGGRTYRPLDAVLVSLARMTAIYRTGNGRGLASVGTDVSCVQDSNCALYGALAAFERPEGVTTDRLTRLGDLVKRLRRSITSHGVTSDDSYAGWTRSK